MNALKRFLKQCTINEGRALIVGSKIHEGTDKPDRRKLYADAIGVDMEEGLGVDRVCNLEEDEDVMQTFRKEGWPADPHYWDKFSHVECTSVLEHSRRPWLLCANLERVMQPGATIFVLVPWVWRVHGYPSDYWRMTPAAVESLFPSIDWEAQGYIVEDNLVEKVPRLTQNGVRYFARSELVMFGRRR